VHPSQSSKYDDLSTPASKKMGYQFLLLSFFHELFEMFPSEEYSADFSHFEQMSLYCANLPNDSVNSQIFFGVGELRLGQLNLRLV
jgi:hypothetical protein